MLAVISLLLQSRKFWWYLLLTSSILLYYVIMTSYCCQRYTECLVTTLFQQDSAPVHCAEQVQQLNCCIKKRQTCLRPTCSLQTARSQSCGLWDLGCHAASCLPQRNPQCRWTETAAHRCLVQPWTVDLWRDYWPCSGEEDIERVSMLNEVILSTACELTMLICHSVTFNVTSLTVTSLITKSCQQRWPIHSCSFYKVVH